MCATIQNPRPTNPNAKIVTIVETPPKFLPPPLTDEHATKVLAAAEAYAQACQDAATIAENVKHLQENLHFAKEKLAEAKKAQAAAKKILAALTRGKEKEEKA